MRNFQNNNKLRLNKLSQIKVAPTYSVTAPIDIWLRRISYISPIILILLGVFGYIYTVLPVFQYQILQEKSAQLELKNIEVKKYLDNLKDARISSETHLNLLKLKLSAAQENLDMVKSEAEASIALLEKTKITVDQLYSKIAWLNFKFANQYVVVGAVKESNYLKGDGAFIEDIASRTTPYERLVVKLDTAKKTNPLPAKYYEKIYHIIKINKNNLTCPAPNLPLMKINYTTEFNLIKKEEAKEKQNLGNIKVISEGKRLAFGVEVKAAAKKLNLYFKYSQKIIDYIQACNVVTDSIFDKMESTFISHLPKQQSDTQ